MRTKRIKIDPQKPDPAVIREAAALLRRGGLVAFPTETVYGLGANLDDPQAIQELYQVKNRPFDKQATLHVASFLEVERREVVVTPLSMKLMGKFWPGPLTLILARPDGSTLGFRMPLHPVALALLQEAQVPVVAPSANISGQSPPRDAEAVWEAFEDKIDFILDAGPTPGGVESTVLDMSQELPRILRVGALEQEIKSFFQEEAHGIRR